MPKNESGAVECINNKLHEIKKGNTSYLVPSIKNSENKSKSPIVDVTKNTVMGFAFNIYYCVECGYTELYDDDREQN